MRTLVRLPNWVGDTVLALPALEGLAAMETDLIFAGRVAPLELTRHLTPTAPRLLLRRGDSAGVSLWGSVRAMRTLGVDQGLLLTPSLSSALSLWLAGVSQRVGWAEQGRGALLTHAVARAPRGTMHIVDEFRELARVIGARRFGNEPHLPPDPQAAQEAEAFLQRTLPDRGDRPLIALCPGVQYGWAKQWPPERFQALQRMVEARDWAGLVIGSASERGLAAEVLAPAGPHWVSAAGEGSLRFAAELLRRCRAAVCNDTGTMHLAAAVGTPVAAVFGPTDPAWTGPVGAGHRVLRAPCRCAPCFERTCPRNEPAPCMVAVDPGQVLEALGPWVDERREAGDP